MKLSKELDDALKAVSQEVDSWPGWKRSIGPDDCQQSTAVTQESTPRETPGLVTRAAKL